ncbi:hypothetical protein SAMN02800692_3609 [Luteibacter sp. UNC138MFCol5.1]|uniref:hypothetical protein n=1 Tax=Luteibacter sp. UNC138MFCol5.1 TaxID=1502774 RepID=UPI0008B1A29C|nr:hypothetical protein [Luteibacter sp. UNC138MFCol5.1]SEP09354.1 hypothetical protein SAMN02800692_3609 [Luteibacter sp. UNC138MFCol5.1]
MNKCSVLFAAAMVAVALMGCATPLDHKTGIEVTQDKLANFKKGVTTTDDVIAAIGHPPEKKEFKGKEVWTYYYTRLSVFPGGPSVHESTVIEFDKAGKMVSAYKAGGVPGKTGNAMLDAAGM